ncbi:MAG: diguanylate cyclase [Oceanospirillales bacterium]|nr:MAG: diguanylate cyclase [Oceanospirillales bacterium]
MSQEHSNTSTDLPSLKSLYNRSSLRAILLSVTFVGLVMGGIGVTKLLSIAQTNVELVARSASVAIEAAVYFDDREIIHEQLEQLLPNTDIRKAELLLPDQIQYEAWRLSNEEQLNWAAQLLVKGLLDPVDVPVSFRNQELATLTLWPNGERILRFMLVGFFALVASLLITSMIIIYTTRRLHTQLSEPLLELAKVSAMVRTNRDFSLRVSRSRIAEIDSLRVDFNALLDELHQWQGTMESLNQHLHYHANHDSLTGVANRHFFEKSLQRALDYAKENGSELSILYLDSNDFKLINDNYGHAAGDQVLREMSHRIKSALRETDLVARVGGDEFAILLNHIGDLDEIDSLKTKIVKAVNHPLSISVDTKIEMIVSIGQARYPQDGDNMDALMHVADYTMYKDKQRQKS